MTNPSLVALHGPPLPPDLLCNGVRLPLEASYPTLYLRAPYFVGNVILHHRRKRQSSGAGLLLGLFLGNELAVVCDTRDTRLAIWEMVDRENGGGSGSGKEEKVSSYSLRFDIKTDNSQDQIKFLYTTEILPFKTQDYDYMR